MFRRAKGTVAAVAALTVALAVVQPVPAAAAVTAVTANFALDDGIGHAEVFGSSINVPALTDPTKIESLHQSGTRFVRGDVYLGHVLPSTTVDAYLAAMRTNTGVADPNTWNWSNYGWVDEHHNRGAKILLLMAYSVPWLGYDPNGDAINFSPPRGGDGLTVYQDVVMKVYQHFRGKVDLVEVWNEPDNMFMQLAGSPYEQNIRGKLAAYKDIYASAAHGIRAVDPTIPIGGPVGSDGDPWQHEKDISVNWPRELLTDPNLAPNVNFLSYHSYNDYSTRQTEDVQAWRQLARDAGKGDDFPVYVTEWNADWSYNDPVNPLNGNHPAAISYTATRLTNFLKLHTNGANYFADNDENVVPQFFGVHRNGMLPPKARTFRLLSVDLGLGGGDSRLRPVSYPAQLSNAGAATTATGDQVAWLVNNTPGAQEVDLTLAGLGAMTTTSAAIFEASPAQNQVRPEVSRTLTVSGGSVTVRLTVPQFGVVGVRLTPYPIADTENLASSATITPSSVSKQDPTLTGANIADGVIRRHGTGEWASDQDLRPNVRLEWTAPRSISLVVLYDRPNFTDRILAGRLVFSDGSTVPVPELPNDGTAHAVSFPVRDTTSLRFEVTSGAGLNVGLSELQVFAGRNVVRDGRVVTSSQVDTWAHGRIRAYDGVTTAAGEWVSTETNPWIRVNWVNSQQVNRVVLFDRPGPADANAGTLSFSDGTSVPVTGIPTDGSPKVVQFPARQVTWVRFQVEGGSGGDVGLAELRVLEAANIASSAVVTGSDPFRGDPTYAPSAVTDGVVNQRYVGEWASNGERTPWLRLTWDTPQTVGTVILFDRNNLTDWTTGGTLLFSDGTSVPVAGMDNTGLGKVITFVPRTVSWLEFRALSADGTDNAGLSEIEAFGATAAKRVESADQPGYFWRHQNGTGRIDPFTGSLDDFRFRIVAGLADQYGTSSESINHPGWYLRHQNSVLKLQPPDGTTTFWPDATFYPVPGPDTFMLYRSLNFPESYIHHDPTGILSIAPSTGPDALFRAG